MKQKSCDCCEGTDSLTPEPTANRPGLGQLTYRVGTHGSFLETMKARLSNLCLGEEADCEVGEGAYPLQGLTTREADDASIAFLDSWATVADVLAFYQERIANECFLNTAQERRSIQELARLVGYKLRPGVAASTYLAFTVEKDQEVEIPAKTRAQSLPGPGEKPQPFETAEPLQARAAWNELKPRMKRPQRITTNDDMAAQPIYLQTVQAKLNPNDPILLDFGNAGQKLFRVGDTAPDTSSKETTVNLLPWQNDSQENNGGMEKTCISFDYRKVEAREVNQQHWVLTDGNELLLDFGKKKAEAKRARQIIQYYQMDQRCVLTHLERDIEYYLVNGEAPAKSSMTGEQCMAFNPSDLQVEERKGRYVILYGKHEIISFGSNEGEAQEALRIIKRYEFEYICFVGNDLLTASMIYFRRDEKKTDARTAPLKISVHYDGETEEERIIEKISMGFDYRQAKVQQSEGGWEIRAENNKRIRVFDKKIEAYQALNVIQSYRLNKQYRVYIEGCDEPIMEYFLASGNVPSGSLEGEVCVAFNPKKLKITKKADDNWELRDGNFSIPGFYAQETADYVLEILKDYEFEYICYIGTKDAPAMIYFRRDADSGVGELVEGLKKRPSSQTPRRRTLAEAFSPGSDTATRLLTAFNPTLPKTLYSAWANISSKLPSELKGLSVLRVKAAPFGHNAALKPVNKVEVIPPDNASDEDAPSYTVDRVTWPGLADTAPNEILLAGEFNQSVSGRWVVIPRLEGDRPIIYRVIDMQPSLGAGHSLSAGTTKLTLDRNWRDENDNTAIVPGGEVIVLVPKPSENPTDENIIKYIVDHEEWPLPADEPLNELVLDKEYDQIVPDSWVVIQRSDEDEPRFCRATAVQPVSRAAYGLSGRATKLTLDQNWLKEDDTFEVVRKTAVYAQSESLPLAQEPVVDDIGSNAIELNGLYDGLEPGRWLILSGERADIPVQESELVMLAGVEQTFDPHLPGDTTHSTLVLTQELLHSYKRKSVIIYGNVAPATHGETRKEVLGSGNGRFSRQTFPLQKSPLTHLAAPTPSGTQSSLELYVNDIRWQEAEGLFWLDKQDRGYITQTDEDDATTVIFGDGQYGTRLPTGVENVRAVYRTGIGSVGNVAAEQISQLAKRPLGVKGVTNPLRASGGADRESTDHARQNAPLAVMALDRLVSVQDYADFARTFAGIAKTHATRLPFGRQKLIHLTIAGANDIPVDPTSELYDNLCQALRQQGNPQQAIQVEARDLLLLIISAQVRLLPGYQWETAVPHIREALLTTFSFKRQELGQDVFLSKVISIMQHVPGVAYVDVDIFGSIPEKEIDAEGNQHNLSPEEIAKHVAWQVEAQSTAGPDTRITVHPTRLQNGVIYPAQLAYLTPFVEDTLILTELS
ncbi:MAG: putative baseplate assembly protein [Anaerolineales bacterium]|nr:putative baseplate assembly protein [Anaerolineales bacterium]